MANRKLKVRWGNYPSAILNMFQTSLKRGQFVDVTLTSDDGQSIKCHRPILSACSAYFDRILSAHLTQNYLVILLTNLKYWQLKALVDLMYSGEVCVTQEQLPEFHKAAQELGIKDLGLPDVNDKEAGLPQGNGDDGQGQPIKRKVMTMSEPPKTHVERSSVQEEAKRSNLEAQSTGVVLPPKTTTGPPVDAEDRAKRLKKASVFVLSGISARAVATHFDIPRTTLRAYMKRRFLRLPDGNEGQDGQSIKRKPPKLEGMEGSSSDASGKEQDGKGGMDEVKKKGKGGIALPPKSTTGPCVDAGDRAERCAKASQLVLGGLIARTAAAHFDIPRTTLLAYMKRHGLRRARKNDTTSSLPSGKNSGSGKQSPTPPDAGSAVPSKEDFPLFGISNVMMMGGGEVHVAKGDAIGKECSE